MYYVFGFFINTQSLRIIPLIEVRVGTRSDTTHDTDARDMNMVPGVERHGILDLTIGKHG